MIFSLLGVSLLFASPAIAKSRVKRQALSHRQLKVTLVNDRRMLAATRIANANAGRHSKRHCWRAVKNALLKAKVVAKRPTTVYAKQAGYELQKKYNFKKLAIRDPKRAPVGAILVYGGRGAGHVEIRTKKGYVSDFTNSRPSRRPLIGVYVTPKMLAANRTKLASR